MSNYGRFGALLGTISIGNSHCKFLIYAVKNAEILTCHETQIKVISQKPGWIEFDPLEIWKCVVECINIGTKNLVFLDINPGDIIALGITNQRETTVLWDRNTGMPVYNAIAWNDLRTTTTLKNLLGRTRNKQNILKAVCGLPLNNCFSALKVKWIIDNVPEVSSLIQQNRILFGTLDTWILWNLTGGIEGGIHITDVTNASRTMLMSLETLRWDAKLCSFFRIPSHILPEIRSCSEVYGFVHDGPLQGVPIASCLAEQPASLLGQMCIRNNQATCTYDESCSLLINTGQEIIDSDNGMLATVAFKLGPKEKVCYALEGVVANAGSAITWLKENLALNTEIGENDNSSTKHNYFDAGVFQANPNTTTDVVFVPAFNGLCSPFWKHDSRGLMVGLGPHTTARQITMAAFEAICFQTRDLIEALHKDLRNWPRIEKLTVGGEFSEKPFLLQLMADLCGVTVDRPHTSSPSCLGAMLAAGAAMKVLNLDTCVSVLTPPSDVFTSSMCASYRDLKYRRWKRAINKCLSWDALSEQSDDPQEEKDPDTLVQQSIPGAFFIFSSFALLLITSQFLRNSSA